MLEEIFKIIILIIIAIFPLLLYNGYLEESKNVTKQEEYLFLDIALFFSQFLLYETLLIFNKQEYFLISVIPCLISLFKKHYISSFVIFSIILVNINNSVFYPICFSFIYSFLFFVIFFIYLKTNMSKRKFVNTFCISELILYIINLIVYIPKDNNIIYEYIMNVICFYVSLKIGCIILLRLETTSQIRKNLRELTKNKDLKDSLFKITHEIKNPIAVVSGYLHMFDTNDKEKSDRYIKIIKEEIERVLNLLSDFLSMTKVSVKKEETSIKTLFDETKEIMLPLFEDKNMKYRFNIEENIKINIDYNRIKQVLINLIKNSIEASNKNDSVLIDGFVSNNKFVIYITDYGKGMSKETQEFIKSNTPFYTTKTNGTGLGVCLSKEIIEAHGGKLSFHSKLNTGTVFKIILPIK